MDMHIHANQQTSHLKTALSFNVIDIRDRSGFPKGQRGFVFVHHERRVIYCRYTGRPIHRHASYMIRTSPQGWRIDEIALGPATAVYGPNGDAYFPTAEDAARALQADLDVIAATSSLAD